MGVKLGRSIKGLTQTEGVPEKGGYVSGTYEG
jgi:hypothetical protein